MGQNGQGRYRVKYAKTPGDIAAAQALRHHSFRAGQTGLDQDVFDDICQHILVTDTRLDHLVCTFRILPLAHGHEIARAYSAQFYDLSALHDFKGGLLEMGRFCIDPDHSDPDILRVAWGAMTKYVDENDIRFLFGCSSFSGTDITQYTDAFALLKARHLAPIAWRPKIKAPQVFRFGAELQVKPDMKQAQKQMPPLLRTYLLMGGWVSDHAVIDHGMKTLHVFTGLEIAAVPENRKRLLRAPLEG
ncbi:MAG: GNAT family N-acyltransferase [Paracoccaceae bacterium]